MKILFLKTYLDKAFLLGGKAKMDVYTTLYVAYVFACGTNFIAISISVNTFSRFYNLRDTLK